MTLTNDCSQAGIVAVGTNVLEPKLSGSTIRVMIPWTDPDVRAIMPTNTDAQHRQSAKLIASRQAASTSKTSVWARKPST